jgi:hypothetical protein
LRFEQNTQKEKERYHFPDLVYSTNRVDPSFMILSLRVHCFLFWFFVTHAHKREHILIWTAPELKEDNYTTRRAKVAKTLDRRSWFGDGCLFIVYDSPAAC